MIKIIKCEPKDHYILDITFNNGKSGLVSFKNEIYGEAFEDLKNESFFKLVEIGYCGCICWPNEADLAPEGVERIFDLQNKKAG